MLTCKKEEKKKITKGNFESIDLAKCSVMRRMLPKITFHKNISTDMLESDMKDFRYTLPLGNSEDLFKIFYFFSKFTSFLFKYFK